MKNSWYAQKWATFLLHAAFWVLLFALPYLVQPSFEKGPPRVPEMMQPPFQRSHPGRPLMPGQPLPGLFFIIKFLFWIVLFYLNAYFLVPAFLNKKRRVAYVLSLVATLVSLSLVELFYFSIAETPARFRTFGFIKFNLFPFLFTLVCSTLYQTYLERREAEKSRKEKETENLKTELSFLRSQMSPHFMFNVLNNMVSLARKKSDLLEPSLIKLSSLMRYFLYENDEEKVSLENEIEYLQSYIDLQQQRFGKNLALSVHFTKNRDYQIAPMLLIPFVENAFKHGIGLTADPVINVTLEVNNGLLVFEVSNKYFEGGQELKDKTAGIGLGNVQRRLDLLYGKDYQLEISKAGGWFEVRLELKVV